MRDGLKRRRLALRAAALCFVLALLCACLLPAFAEGTELPEEEPGLSEEADEPDDEPEEPPEETPGGEQELFPEEDENPDEPELPAEPEPQDPDEDPEEEMPLPEETDEAAEVTYTFWLSEADEREGGLPYAEQTVRSGGELLMPEEPEAEGKSFCYWYTRDEEGSAVRFTPPEGELRPGEKGEYSLYARFIAADAQEEETDALPEEGDAALEEEAEEADPAENAPDSTEQTEEAAGEEEETLPEEEELLTEEDAEDTALLEAKGAEDAAVFLLRSPTCQPGSNDTSQWAPKDSECRWLGRVDTRGAVWSDGGKNILTNVADCIVSWPDGTTGTAWTLKPGDSYWSEVVDEIWDEYRDSIEKATGITGLTREDLESLTVTPYKISRRNGTSPDKHIDCTISVKSRKSFTARFNLRAPGEEDYAIVDSREYRSGERVEKTEVEAAQQISVGGVLYVFDGWYCEESGPEEDAPGTRKITQNQWDAGYLPDEEELENGVVNFYAHYVLADVDPDTGVRVEFFALPLVLGAGAAALCGRKTRKEEGE